jgi:glycerophosphoryl diester phosphodiesterase
MKATLAAHWRTVLARLPGTIRPFLAVHVAYTVLALAVLTPLTGLVVRILLGLGGNAAVADQDIAWFLLSPLGMASLVLVAGLIVAIIVVEQSAMMGIAAAAGEGHRPDWAGALKFALGRAPVVLDFGWRLVVRVLLIVLPFLAVGAVVAWLLITDHDINFYLSARPPEFIATLVIAALLALVMAAILFSRLADWSLALPLILFAGVGARASFAESRRRLAGHRREVFAVLVSWAAFALAAGLLVVAVTDAFGSWLVPRYLGDLRALVLALGLVAAIGGFGSLLAGALGGGSFALLIMSLHARHTAGIEPVRLAPLRREASRQSSAARSVRAVVVLAAVAVAAIGLGAWLLKDSSVPDDAIVVAHRGAAGRAPENTLASVRAAIEDGTDWVEIDVQETRDGQVIVVHDSDFMKLSGVPLKVWDGTLAQIGEVDVGGWFGPAFAGERVPTLESVLETVRASSARLVIELKYYGHDQALERRVVDLVEGAGMADRVAIMSLKYAGVQKIRGLRPDWTVGLLSATAIGDLTRLDADFLAVNLAMAKPGFIRQAHRAGKKVFVWTVNDPVTMSRVLSLGVDGVITDEPAMARQVVAERAEMSTAERLLVHAAVVFGKPLPPRDYRDESP